tara:strand:+ start:2867 stop:3709 length:843 start_codon:yes stop_codon:yes gene_type:complete
MAFKFRDPLIIIEGTGLIINPSNTEIFGTDSPSLLTTIAIGQAVATNSNIVINNITITNEKFIIDNENTILTSGVISGSMILSTDFTTTKHFTGSGDLTVLGTLIAEKIETELTKSFTMFESGSTLFGNTYDDTHEFSGSFLVSGSLALSANTTTREISNDTSLTDSSAVAIVTENAAKNYTDDSVEDEQPYLRKCFAHTGSFLNSSTSSFTAVTASAPSSLSSTSEEDFMFFINGQIMENDALTIQQSGTSFLLKVDSDSIGYDLESNDEIIAWGKFNS